MSVNAVDQTTGNTTPLAGNTNNLVGNLSALTTNTKSDAVGAINEVNQTKQNATDNNLQTTDKTIVGGINELVSGLTSVNNRLATVSLTYDDQDEIYPVPADKKPTDDLPITCTARNRQTGALYLLWYNGGAGGFKVGHVISGSAPTANQTAVVQYFT